MGIRLACKRRATTYLCGCVRVLARRNLFLVMEYLPGGDFMSLLECIVQLEEQVRACVAIVTQIYRLVNSADDCFCC